VKLVVGLGGNALMRRGEDGHAEASAAHLARAADVLAGVSRDHTVVVAHGNGPQVGLLALQAEAYDPDRPIPLDVLGAETEGMIGYLLERELRTRMPERRVAALLTQVAVDPADPAFRSLSKPIGPVYSEERAGALAAERGWVVGPDESGWRRLVASPRPQTILEIDTIRLLVEARVVLICGGGGGIPVTIDASDRIRGVEAVIDKDATAALLATELGADGLVLLTDVEGVMEGWGTPGQRLLPEITVSAARELALPAGSMGPKLQACTDFVEAGGGFAAIGRLEDGLAVVEGRSGTRVVPSYHAYFCAKRASSSSISRASPSHHSCSGCGCSTRQPASVPSESRRTMVGVADRPSGVGCASMIARPSADFTTRTSRLSSWSASLAT
jgi:carbamate kinase